MNQTPLSMPLGPLTEPAAWLLGGWSRRAQAQVDAHLPAACIAQRPPLINTSIARRYQANGNYEYKS
jgi:hypothetical protein